MSLHSYLKTFSFLHISSKFVIISRGQRSLFFKKMAILGLNDQHQQETLSFLLDSLFCEEEEIGVECLDEEFSDKDYTRYGEAPSVLPLVLLDQDLFWEDEELISLFSKEKESHLFLDDNATEHPILYGERGEAIEWMLKVKAHYGFSALTAVLAINFFDRFVCSVQFREDEPWTIQLAAVTCLSLAAKVEETRVPLLLDLQVGESKYFFEAKTIQNMELLVMSTLQWRMNPVTPLSFLDHTMRRLGLKNDLHWEFFKKCEALLLSVVADRRFARYLPSVLATATMLHVIIHQVEPLNAIEYQNQLLSFLRTTEEKINECYELIGNISNTCCTVQKDSHKRKFEDEEEEIQGSPRGVIEASFSSDSSSDSCNGGFISFFFTRASSVLEKHSSRTEFVNAITQKGVC